MSNFFSIKKIRIIVKANPTYQASRQESTHFAQREQLEKPFALVGKLLCPSQVRLARIAQLAHSVFTFALTPHFDHAAARFWWCGGAKYVPIFNLSVSPYKPKKE